MYDPNLQEFHRRVERLEAARPSGLRRAVSKSAMRRASRGLWQRVVTILRPALIACLVFVALKGGIHHAVGAATYDQRLAELAQGEGPDRLGAWLMEPDPVSSWVSGQLAVLLN